jgi:hypothetical protein
MSKFDRRNGRPPSYVIGTVNLAQGAITTASGIELDLNLEHGRRAGCEFRPISRIELPCRVVLIHRDGGHRMRPSASDLGGAQGRAKAGAGASRRVRLLCLPAKGPSPSRFVGSDAVHCWPGSCS